MPFRLDDRELEELDFLVAEVVEDEDVERLFSLLLVFWVSSEGVDATVVAGVAARGCLYPVGAGVTVGLVRDTNSASRSSARASTLLEVVDEAPLDGLSGTRPSRCCWMLLTRDLTFSLLSSGVLNVEDMMGDVL